MSRAEMAMYTGLSLQAVQRLKSGEDWLQWMRVEERSQSSRRSRAS